MKPGTYMPHVILNQDIQLLTVNNPHTVASHISDMGDGVEGGRNRITRKGKQ
jgi:hypothetical protein